MTNIQEKRSQMKKTLGNIYGLRTWVEYGFRQCKQELGWTDYRFTNFNARVYSCPECSYTTDRDVAAAQIVMQRGVVAVGRTVQAFEGIGLRRSLGRRNHRCFSTVVRFVPTKSSNEEGCRAYQLSNPRWVELAL